MRLTQALVFLCFLLLAGQARPAGVQTGPPCRAAAVLRELRLASGADRLAGVAELSASGTAVMAGLRGRARFDDDLLTGRYARRFEIAVMGSSGDVFDGSTLWTQDISGGVRPMDSPYAREQAVTGAYLARRGYLDPATRATLTCLGPAGTGATRDLVVRVRPNGGAAVDLAVNAQTHLLDSVTERAPFKMQVVRLGDYRAVGDAVLPFQIESGTVANPTDDYLVNVGQYRTLRPAADGDFARPVRPRDARMVGGVASSTVPIMLEGRQLMVWASIDGNALMPFILDTGGHAILTSQAAQRLGLQSSGAGESGGSGAGTIATAYTRVHTLRIGAAEIRDQPFLIIPYPYSFYERGKRVPLAGIIGLEFFERFAVRLDYGDLRATFTPLRTFRYRGNAAHVPFTFETDPDMPMVDASADRYPGLFGVDTGNAGSLILFGDYLDRTGLATRYPNGVTVIGHGTGGSNRGYLVSLPSFRIGGREIANVTTAFTHMSAGSFASWTQAGNLGLSILSRFIPTFDYANRVIYLEPQRHTTTLLKNRSGMGVVKNGPDAFDVVLVKPQSPADRLGIVAGDRIVAINGEPAANYSAADLYVISGQAGASLRLRVEHNGSARDVVLVLAR